MESAERRSARLLLGGGILLLALFAFGTLRPRDPDFDLTFGVDGYSHLGVGVFLIAGAVLLAVLLLPGMAARLGDLFARLGGAIPRGLRTPLLVCCFGAFFWLLPNWTLSGDAGSVLFRLASEDVYPSNSLTNFVFLGLQDLVGSDPVTAVRLTSCLAGLVYVWCAAAIGRECAPEGPGRAGITALLLTTGTVALFFGTIEVYAPLVAGVSAYALFGIRWLNGKGRGVAPALCLGIAFCLHGSAGLLIPSLLVLANEGRILPLEIGSVPWWRRMILRTAPFLLVIVGMFIVLFFVRWGGEWPEAGAERYGSFLGTEGEGPILPLTLSPSDPGQRYALLDAEHIVAILNLLLLVAPVGLLLFFSGRRTFGDPRFRFVAVAALFLLLFPILWNIGYSMRRDWDLFSSLGVILALLGGFAWFESERTRAGVVRVAVLSVFCTIPFVLSNSRNEQARQQYARVAGREIGLAVPKVVANEVGEVVELRAAEAGLEVPGADPRAFRREIEAVVGRILWDSKALVHTRVRLDPERFREELHLTLQGPEARLEAGADRALLADLATEELNAEIERIRNSRSSLPDPGVLAFTVSERVSGREELPRLMGNPPYDRDSFELSLLEALDAVMEQRAGFAYERTPFDESSWRREIAWCLKELVVRRGWLMDPERWSVLVAESIGEVLSGSGRGGRRLRWPAVDASAERWTREAETGFHPGADRAYARAQWLWIVANDALRTERDARHWLVRTPEDGDWLNLLFVVLHRGGRTVEGLELLRRAVRAKPTDLRVRLNLAEALRDLGRSDEALKEVRTGLRLDSWHGRAPWGFALLAEIRLERGEIELARSHLGDALASLERAPPSEEAVALRTHLDKIFSGRSR